MCNFSQIPLLFSQTLHMHICIAAYIYIAHMWIHVSDHTTLLWRMKDGCRRHMHNIRIRYIHTTVSKISYHNCICFIIWIAGSYAWGSPTTSSVPCPVYMYYVLLNYILNLITFTVFRVPGLVVEWRGVALDIAISDVLCSYIVVYSVILVVCCLWLPHHLRTVLTIVDN